MRSNLTYANVSDRIIHEMAAQQMVEQGEEWRSIPGFNGRYEASSEGRIRNASTLLIRRPVLNWAGYCRVRISPLRGIEAKIYSVHRLVLMTFATNPHSFPQIDHIDCNKSNNALRNLEYVTAQENSRRAWENGLMTTTAKAVDQLDLYGKLIKRYESQTTAEKETGISQSCISKAILNNRPGFGFRWKFVSV
jgi:hypothetical protein